MHTPFARLRPGFFLACLGALLALAGCPHPLPADPSAATDSAGAIASLDTTGVRDAAPAIQSALDALPDHGGTVTLPAGNLVLRSPLVIGPGAIWRRNVRLLGAGSVGADSSTTTLRWAGDPHTVPLQIRGAHQVVEGLKIVAGDRPLDCAIDIDWDAASGMEMTRDALRHVCVQGPMAVGVRLAATAPANGDDCDFEDVTIGGFTRYGLYIASRNMQSKCHNLRRCRFETGAGYPGSRAVYAESGSVRLYSCWFEGSEVLLHTNINTDYQLLQDCQAEGFKAICYCGGAINGMPVVLRGGRYGYSIRPNRLQISVRGGPLLMQGVKFEGDYLGDQWEADCEGADWAPTGIIAEGCWFPTDRPHFTADQHGFVQVRGCRGERPDRSEVSFADWARNGGSTTLVGHQANVVTSTPGDNAEPSALLNLVSGEQGFLPPRMSTAQRLAIAAPAEGLVVYDLDLHALCVRGAEGWMVLTAR